MMRLKSILCSAISCCLLMSVALDSVSYASVSDWVYFHTMDVFGVPKRDIFIDRVEDATEAQVDAQEQVKTTLEKFAEVVRFDGGDLEKMYNKLNDEYEECVDAADDLHQQIVDIQSVAEALFAEWEAELTEYASRKLRRESQRKLRETRRQYNELLAALKAVEGRLQPVLTTFKDHVLYLKHNLNARAIASIRGELDNMTLQVDELIREMNTSIDVANAFIQSMSDKNK